MIDKAYELRCDNPNCRCAMNHLYGTLREVKFQAKELGHIIVGNKCYCDQKCFKEKDK